MKKTSHHYYFPLGLFFLCSVMPCLAMAAPDITTDQLSLLALKAKAISDPHHILAKNWSAASSVCDWRGVTCGSRHRRVTALHISSLGLNGTIPPQLGNLSFLVFLDMSGNNFKGELPYELIHLRRLRVLNFTDNRLTGNIPPWIGSFQELIYFSLGNNSFAGSIPPSISNMSNLETIYLLGNSLQGTIPGGIGNLNKLKYLDMSYNQLSGSLPLEIFNISTMEIIAFENNSLSGSLPFSIFPRLQALRWLVLASNKLSGTIPEGLGNLTALQVLDLGYNNLHGRIPEDIGNLNHLEYLSLSLNTLTGTVPDQIFNISTLRTLGLESNKISGSLPSSMGFGLNNLEKLYLVGNEFEGLIPASISNASELTVLELAVNRFSGPIPNSLGNLRLLACLHLQDNYLTSDPSSRELSIISYLTNCRDLMSLGLSYNPLSSFLPTSVGNLSTSMESFYADYCGIHGSIPDAVWNLSSLFLLNLNGNHLKGHIPITMKYLQNLQGLNLSDNQLSGSIPASLCELKSLCILLLAENQLGGSIPSCLGNISSMREISFGGNFLNSSIPASLWNLTDLLTLNLSYNSLGGSLPQDIGKLEVVTLFDLSGNHINGDIPSSIGGLQSLVTLSVAQNELQGPIPDLLNHMFSLEFLDLSKNNLSGPIPKSLVTLTHLKYINLSFNHLSGEIPSVGPFKNFTYESFMFNDDLCGRFHFAPCSSPRTHKWSRKKVFHILGIVSGIAATVIAVTIAVILFLRCRRKDEISSNTDLLPMGLPKMISYSELVQATNGYDESNLIGKGSFGTVYKGILKDGTVVAVKVFTSLAEVSYGSFNTECEVLRNLRHRNLTKVIGSCSNLDFKALVLDYKSSGSLEKWLYSHNHGLDLLQRIGIMVDVASALEYLHFGCKTPVVHCDLKPSNILLDDSMVAHVSDFGMARLLDEGNSVLHTKTLATLGYLAPEYGLEGMVSARVDVYSFGIVLMEVFSKMKPSDGMFSEDLSLKSWIAESLPNKTIHVTDAYLLGQQDEHFNERLEYVSMIFRLGLSCCTERPQDRINMKDAAAGLKKIKRRLEYFSSISA